MNDGYLEKMKEAYEIVGDLDFYCIDTRKMCRAYKILGEAIELCEQRPDILCSGAASLANIPPKLKP